MKDLIIEFYKEHDVIASDKEKLRELLQLSFPMLKCFTTSPYWMEPPHYRWLIRNQDKIIANICVIDKAFLSGSNGISIAGIAYICIHPKFRRRGLVKNMLTEIHDWARNKGYPFAFLFGRTEIYQSSGHIKSKNEFKYVNHRNNMEEVKQIDYALHALLQEEPWPESLIDIQGPRF